MEWDELVDYDGGLSTWWDQKFGFAEGGQCTRIRGKE